MRYLYCVFISLGAILVLFLLFIYSGAFNVAATSGHNPVTRWVLGTITERSIETHAPSEGSIQPSQNLKEGYEEFSKMCVMCHGSPISPRAPFAKHMTPMPPELSEEAEEFSLEELTWIIEHGIKMTGMPAFGPLQSREKSIAIATFVDTLPSLSVSEYKSFIEKLGSTSETNHSHKEEGTE